ncbi:MAG: DUF349 domain-containing protein [Thermonemataceae bacterium]
MNIDEKDIDKESMEEPTSQESHPEEVSTSSTTENTSIEQEETKEDYSDYNKDALYQAAQQWQSQIPEQGLATAFERVIAIKKVFDEIVEQEKNEALEKFLAEGGEESDFAYKGDDTTAAFSQLYQALKKRKDEEQKTAEATLQKNLEARQALIEKLRGVINSTETANSIQEIKAIQSEWKEIGNVPKGMLRNLWASYNALLDIYYNNQSLYNELKELDRKKNLEAKIVLCEKAEHLSQGDDIKEAVKVLNELHHEFKHIGPVPKEEQEKIWERFKAASDAIYDKKRAQSERFKEEMQENLVHKQALCAEVKIFEDFQSDKIKAWNEKTQELLAIQKKWEAIGMLPREKAKEVTKAFWASFKTFFRHKGEFFKQLDELREENFQKKLVLLQKAQEVVDNQNEEETEKAAEELKHLQQQWKTIGPVPEKKKEEVVTKFRTLLDNFFEGRRQKFADRDKVYKENFQKKLTLCEEIESSAKEATTTTPSKAIKGFIDTWKSIGFVPRKQKDKIADRFQEAIAQYIQHLSSLSEEEKETLQIEAELSLTAGRGKGNSRSFDRKEESIRRKVKQLEEELTVLNNNLGFFANSKQANKLKEDFEKKASDLTKEITSLKKQLKTLRNLKKDT